MSVEALEALHDPRYNLVRDVAHNFVTRDLGLDAAPIENFALVSHETFAAMRRSPNATVNGEYDPVTNRAVLVQAEDPANPFTAAAKNTSSAVHEITHSVNGATKGDTHLFLREAFAGLAEAHYLAKRSRMGLRQPASDFLLRRAGVELLIPGTFRYLDMREAARKPQRGAAGAYTSQGLIAALGIAYASQEGGIRTDTLLKMSNIRSEAGYYGLQYVLNKTDPDLLPRINALPETTNGIIQATALIQETVARKQK